MWHELGNHHCIIVELAPRSESERSIQVHHGCSTSPELFGHHACSVCQVAPVLVQTDYRADEFLTTSTEFDDPDFFVSIRSKPHLLSSFLGCFRPLILFLLLDVRVKLIVKLGMRCLECFLAIFESVLFVTVLAVLRGQTALYRHR